MEGKTLTRVIAEYVHGLSYEALPEEIQEVAKTRILDSLSCCYGALDLPWPRVAVEFVRGSRGKATVIGHDLKVPSLDAALVNSVLAHSILQEDTGPGGHPSTIVVPAVLAVAEEESSSGKEALTALVAGYEIMARTAFGGDWLTPRPFRPSPIYGTFGAAAAAGKLMRLTPAHLTHALGYAATLASGLQQGWWSGTMEQIFHSGFAARNGIFSAALARKGATTAPDILEGKHGFYKAFAGTLDHVGEVAKGLPPKRANEYFLSRVTWKPYPACNLNQLPIDLALKLAKEHRFRLKEVVRVVEKVSPRGKIYPGSDRSGPAANQYQAQMSAQFCLSAALLGKPILSHEFYYEHYNDPEVAELARKVELIGEEGRLFPRIEVYLRDGKVHSIEEDTRPGLVPTKEAIEAKFIEKVSEPLGSARAKQILELTMGLEKVDNIRKFTQYLGKI